MLCKHPVLVYYLMVEFGVTQDTKYAGLCRLAPQRNPKSAPSSARQDRRMTLSA